MLKIETWETIKIKVGNKGKRQNKIIYGKVVNGQGLTPGPL